MKEVGVAVVGLGGIGWRRAHILRQMPHVRFLGISELDEERARNIAEQYSADYWSTDHKKVIERPEVDVVVVSTGEDEHAGVAIDALNLGKPVLIEKPLAMNLKDADRILDAAKASEQEVFVGYSYRIQQRYMVSKEQIQRGAIGDVVNVVGKAYITKREARRNATRSGYNTPIINVGAYMVDLALWFLEKRPVQVYAKSGSFVFADISGKKPEFTWAIVTFEDGSIANLGASWLLPENHPSYIATEELELFGTKGYIQIDDSHRDHLITSDEPMEHLSMARSPRTVAFGGTCMPGEWALGEFFGPMKEETTSFINHVAYGRPTPLTTGEVGRQVLEVALAIDISAEKGMAVDLPLIR